MLAAYQGAIDGHRQELHQCESKNGAALARELEHVQAELGRTRQTIKEGVQQLEGDIQLDLNLEAARRAKILEQIGRAATDAEDHVQRRSAHMRSGLAVVAKQARFAIGAVAAAITLAFVSYRTYRFYYGRPIIGK